MKGSVAERGGNRDFPPVNSLPKWLQRLDLSQDFFHVSLVAAEGAAGLSSTAFPSTVGGSWNRDGATETGTGATWMPVSHEVALPTSPQCRLLPFSF